MNELEIEYTKNIVKMLNKMPIGRIHLGEIDSINQEEFAGLKRETRSVIEKLDNKEVYLKDLNNINFKGNDAILFRDAKTKLDHLLSALIFEFSVSPAHGAIRQINTKRDSSDTTQNMTVKGVFLGSTVVGPVNKNIGEMQIIEILQKAVEMGDYSKDQKKNALETLKDLKNDPVISQVLAYSITKLAGILVGLPPN